MTTIFYKKTLNIFMSRYENTAKTALKRRPLVATVASFVATLASLNGLTSCTAWLRHIATLMPGPAKDLCRLYWHKPKAHYSKVPILFKNSTLGKTYIAVVLTIAHFELNSEHTI